MPTTSAANGFGFEKLRSYESVSLNYEAMSNGLKKAGLVCKDNTPAVVRKTADEIVGALPTGGPRFFVAAPEGKAKEYEYVVDPLNEHYSKMMVLLDNLDKVKQIYSVDHHEKENKFDSTALGALRDVFTEVGKMIGNVQGGHVDPEQIGSEIGNVISSLTESTSRDFHELRRGPRFLVGGVEGTSARGIVGLKYFYEFTVNDYKDKKVETHHSDYKARQDNVLFTDVNIFEQVYEKVVA